MTTKQKAEEIRRICIEANPSIKDLVFGCEVEWIDLQWTVAHCCIKGKWLLTSKNKYSVILEPEKLKIIGRPITIADILVAMEKKDIKTGIRNNGGFVDIGGFQELNGNYTRFWDLPHDSLDYHTEHHPETVDFIWSLLVKK